MGGTSAKPMPAEITEKILAPLPARQEADSHYEYIKNV
jgi:hypothetical protein